LAEVTELDSAPVRVMRPIARLPATIADKGAPDTVTLVAIVDTEGRVANVEQVQAATPENAQFAAQLVRTWEFSPSTIAGKPARFRMPVTVALRPGVPDVRATGADPGAYQIDLGAGVLFATFPQYPAALGDAPRKGFAAVEVTVGPDGSISDPIVEYTSHPAFAAPAADCVREWVLAPVAAPGGTPLTVRTSLDVVFRPEHAGWTPQERDLRSRLVYARSFDEGPVESEVGRVVFPYKALLAGETGSVGLQVLISPEGRVIETAASTDSEFTAALLAALPFWRYQPATKAGRPVFASTNMVFVFNPDHEEFGIEETARELIAGLRAGTAPIFSLKEVSTPPRPLAAMAPSLPADYAETRQGEAVVECIICPDRRVRLPKIVRSTTPMLGWAAATAALNMTFEPATKDGQPVFVRARLPVKFSSEPPSDPAPAAP